MRVKVFIALATLWVGVCVLHAQEVMMEGEVRGFSLPLYNRDQQLQAKITGSRASFPDEERIQINDLSAELYESGSAQSKVTSREALFYKSEQRLEAKAGVQIEHPQIGIQSELMNWTIPSKRGEFRDKVVMRLLKPHGTGSVTDHDHDQDMIITADRLDLSLVEGKGTFYGNINVRHSKGSIECQRAEMEFEPMRPERLIRFIAQRQVRWISGKRAGRCHALSYDWKQNKILLQGQVEVEEETRRLISEKVSWDEQNQRLVSHGPSRVEIVSETAQR